MNAVHHIYPIKASPPKPMLTIAFDLMLTPCCGTMEQACATEGMLNTLNLKEKKDLMLYVSNTDGLTRHSGLVWYSDTVISF